MAAYCALTSLLQTLGNILDRRSRSASLDRDHLVHLRERASELRQYLGNSSSPNARTGDELQSLETKIREVAYRAINLLAGHMYEDQNSLFAMIMLVTGLFISFAFIDYMFQPAWHILTMFSAISLVSIMMIRYPSLRMFCLKCFCIYCLKPFTPDNWNVLLVLAICLCSIALAMITNPFLRYKLKNWLVSLIHDNNVILSELLEDFDSLATEVITIGTDVNDVQLPPRDLSSTASSS